MDPLKSYTNQDMEQAGLSTLQDQSENAPHTVGVNLLQNKLNSIQSSKKVNTSCSKERFDTNPTP